MSDPTLGFFGYTSGTRASPSPSLARAAPSSQIRPPERGRPVVQWLLSVFGPFLEHYLFPSSSYSRVIRVGERIGDWVLLEDGRVVEAPR